MIELSKPSAYHGLSNNQLKIIAMLTMLIDHVALQFFPTLLYLRIPGRISFPIFAYMIAEGCRYTRNRTRYLLQLAILGTLCQAVFTFVTGALYFGILITFSLSILTIYAIDAILSERRIPLCLLLYLVPAGVLFVVLILPIWGIGIDYGLCGVILPVLLYYTHGKWKKLLCMTGVLAIYALLTDPIKWFALLAVPLLALYNDTHGKHKLKYLFYIFYPAHFIAIYLVDILLHLFTQA